MTDRPNIKAHLFICTKCKSIAANGEELKSFDIVEFRKKVKDLAIMKWSKKDVRVSESSCLGQCSKGVNAVCYPQNEWLHNLTKEDDKKVITLLERVMNL